MKCTHPNAVASSRLIKDQTVMICRACRSICLEGDTQWILGGSGSLEQLRKRAAQIKEEKEREEHFMQADVDGPLWERVS